MYVLLLLWLEMKKESHISITIESPRFSKETTTASFASFSHHFSTQDPLLKFSGPYI
jgi:hypothetical protein